MKIKNKARNTIRSSAKKHYLFSVIVTTRNRSNLLKKCLDSLLNQSIDKKEFEVVVINNNSVDNTEVLLKRYQKLFPNFNTIFEERESCGHARKVGSAVARGKWLAFIDDDAYADFRWLENAANFIANNPKAVVFGGPYDRYCLVEIPDWFPEDYGKLNYGNQNRELDLKNESITGSNFFILKQELNEVGGFNSDLGMNGNSLGYGEEIQILYSIQSRNKPIYYVYNVKVFHNLAKYKLSLKWMIINRYFLGKYFLRSSNKKSSFLFYISGLCIAIFHSLASVNPFNGAPIKRRLYYFFGPYVQWIGTVAEYISVG